MLAILLPYSKARVRTPLERREILARLASDRGLETGLELDGSTDHSFQLVWKQRPWRQIPYLPLVRGRLTDVGDGTDIELVFSIQPVECLTLLCLFAGISVVSLSAGEGLGYPILCLLAYHLGGMVFGFRPAREKSEHYVRRVLGERAAT